MRLLLKVLFCAAALAALCWLVPEITASFNHATEAGSTADASRAYGLFSLYLILGAALAVFVAWDVSHFFGELAGSLFVGSGRLPNVTPVLWKADRLRKQGEPLTAINGLRDHLKTHPRQWYVALRIAELYQRDLNDPLSAALEYEALLQRRLPGSARAETLLRLAACQLLLRNPNQSAATLRAVIEGFPKSPAAEKAKRRLSRMETEPGHPSEKQPPT